jgi:hypothetical protein
MNQSPAYPVIDGFTLNTKLRPNLTFLNLVLRERLDHLRRSGSYRTRMWCIPEDASSQQIPADDALEYQVSVMPGAVIWGWIFVATGADAGQFSIQITDGCTDVPVFSEVVNLSAAAPTHSIMPGQGKQRLLTRLLNIGQPGLLNVQICSLNNAAVENTQLILCGAEPVSQDKCKQD